MADEARHILGLDHAVFNELGASDDALQRRFELVRHVCGKFTARLLGGFALGDIEAQKNGSDFFARGLDAADVKLVNAAGELRARLTVSCFARAVDGLRDIGAPVERQEILPDAACLRAEKLACRRVDAQNDVLIVEQHETLGHALRDVGELVGLALELAQLIVDLLMLAVNPAEQRGNLIVGLRLERVIEIDGVERLDNAAGEPFSQKRAENHSGEQNDQHRLNHAKQQHRERLLRDADTEHAPVVHTPCDVDRLFKKRLRIPAAFALAGGQRLLYFLARGVVLHRLCVGLRIVEHRAVRRDPRQAVAVRVDRIKICFAALRHAGGSQGQLIAQRLGLETCKVIVQAAHDQHEACQQRAHGDKQRRAENFLCHFEPSHR